MDRWLARRWLWLSVGILLLAVATRLPALRDVPPGLAQDEVLDADIALFIRGGEHALFFRHGYGHEPLYHYFAVPFQALLGDNLLSIRLPAAVLGLLLVALVLRWARRDFGPVAAAVAGLLLAVGWWPIIFSRIGIRPIMEPVILMLSVLLWPLAARAVTERTLIRTVGAGLFLGLSFYTYTAARVLFLQPVLLALYWLARRLLDREPGTRRLAGVQLRLTALVLVLAAVVYAPMGLTLRADPDLQQRVDQLEGPLTSLREGDPGPVLAMSVATLGVFSFTGDPRWTYSLPGRPIFDPLTALLFYAGLIVALARWRDPRYAFLPMWLAVALLPSALTPDAPSTVRLVGAIPVVHLLPGLAVSAGTVWLSRRPGRAKPRLSRLLVPVALALLLLLNLVRTVADGFIRWPSDLETHLKYQTVVRDIGLHAMNTPGGAPVVADAFFEPIDASSLARNAGRDLAARWVQTGEGVAGALVWPGGEGESSLYVPEFAPLDPELAAAAGLSPEPAERSPGRPSFSVYHLANKPQPAGGRRAAFAPSGAPPRLSLTGLTMPGGPAEEQLRLLTTWEVDGRLPEDLAIFVHLLNDRGDVVAQHDGLDAAPATLRPGDVVLQRHVLPLPADLAAGEYTLRLGLYRRNDGSRWTTGGADGLAAGRCAVETQSENMRCVLSGQG
jgi:hypothetical protein